MSWLSDAGTVDDPFRDKPNQDRVVVRLTDGIAALVLADGAGSLAESHVGANIATRTAMRTLNEAKAHPDDLATIEKVVREAVDAARSAVLAEPDWRQMGCTLAVAVVTESAWCVGAVGDSLAVVHHTDGRHELVTDDGAGEYANITRLITSADADPIIVSGTEPVLGLSVASDGLTQVSTSQGFAAESFWTPVLARVRRAEPFWQPFLEHLVDTEQLFDDTTAATILWFGERDADT